MELLIALVACGVLSTAAGRHTLTRHAEEYGRAPDPVERAYELLLTMIGEDPQGGDPITGEWWEQALGWCVDWQGARVRLADARARRAHLDARVPEWALEDGRLVAATLRVPMAVDTAPGSRFRGRFPARWQHAFPNSDWSLDWRRDNAVEAAALEPLPETVERDPSVSDTWHRVPLGVTREGPVLWDLSTYPHMLVSGRTGKGKTVALRTILSHLAEHGCRIRGIDLKRVDLGWIRAWEGCTTVRPDRDPERAMAPIAEALVGVVGEMHGRYQRLERAGLTSIDKLEDPPDPLVLVIDELGEMADDTSAPDREHRRRAWTQLGSIASLGRAAGIHLLCATQHPYASLLSGGLRDNLEGRLAVGWLPDNLSPVAVDGPQATELLDPSDPPGRGVVRLGRHQVLQTYWTPPIETPPADDDADNHHGGSADPMRKYNHRRQNPQGSAEGRNNQQGAVTGDAIRAAREAAGLTQAQLAAAAEVSQAYISQVERSIKPASDRLIDAIDKVCGESTDERERH